MAPPPSPHPQTPFDPIAGVLALAFPGAGHLIQRRYKRAFYVAVGILGLYFGGLLIGGLSVVDRQSPRSETRISFIAQAFVGPIAFATDYIHQNSFKTTINRTSNGKALPPVIAPPGQNRMNLSLGKVNEIGVLYTVIAGMLNFIVFLDALLPSARRENKREDAEPLRTTGALDAVLEKGAP